VDEDKETIVATPIMYELPVETPWGRLGVQVRGVSFAGELGETQRKVLDRLMQPAARAWGLAVVNDLKRHGIDPAAKLPPTER